MENFRISVIKRIIIKKKQYQNLKKTKYKNQTKLISKKLKCIKKIKIK